jgi:hypothetical protein
MSQEINDPQLEGNVVERLRTRIRKAKACGFVVRQELLGSYQSTWCEVGGRKMLFLDAAQPAREQIATIDEVLEDYRASISRNSTGAAQPDN